MNFLYEEDRHDENNYEPMLHVHSVNNVDESDPIILQLMVKGQPVNMKLYTGSSVSNIPETFYQQNLSDVPFQKNKITLKHLLVKIFIL